MEKARNLNKKGKEKESCNFLFFPMVVEITKMSL